jgi:hypothetical protein
MIGEALRGIHADQRRDEHEAGRVSRQPDRHQDCPSTEIPRRRQPRTWAPLRPWVPSGGSVPEAGDNTSTTAEDEQRDTHARLEAPARPARATDRRPGPARRAPPPRSSTRSVTCLHIPTPLYDDEGLRRHRGERGCPTLSVPGKSRSSNRFAVPRVRARSFRRERTDPRAIFTFYISYSFRKKSCDEPDKELVRDFWYHAFCRRSAPTLANEKRAPRKRRSRTRGSQGGREGSYLASVHAPRQATRKLPARPSKRQAGNC